MPRILKVLVFLALIAHAPAFAEPTKTVSLKYRDADLVYVLKQVGKQLDMNVFVGARVRGTVTIEVTDSSLEDVLEELFGQTDPRYQYKISGTSRNALIIALPENLQRVEDALIGLVRVKRGFTQQPSGPDSGP